MASSPRIDELRKKFEENPRRYFAPLANEYRKAGDIDQAITICREYLPQQPGHMSGHIVYGQALYEARQFEEAKTVFETALSLDPENLIALRHLGDIALIVGDSEGARAWYRRVLEADPRNEEIQAQLTSLEQAAPPPAPVSSFAPTVVVGVPSQPTPTKETPVVPPPAVSGVTADSPTAEVRVDSVPKQPAVEIEKSVEATIEVKTPVAGPTIAAPTPASEATIEVKTPAAEAPLSFQPTSSPAQVPPADSRSLEGLETTAMGAEPAAPPVTAQPPRDAAAPQAPVADIPLLDLGEPARAVVAESVEQKPAERPAPPAPPESGPFVTETMAELYLQQGHREEALRVYRALLEQRPDDVSLRSKIASLSPPIVPTIRDVLSSVASRRPGFRAEPLKQNGVPSEAASTPTAAATPAPPPVPTSITSPTASAPAAPPAGAMPGDGLSALFGHAAVGTEDEHAATALALAFSGENGQSVAPTGGAEASVIAGTPARHTPSDMSLDKVFGSQASSSAPANFSFDQFFSQRATAENPTAGGGSGSASAQETRDDVAQFTKWLEGLKGR